MTFNISGTTQRAREESAKSISKERSDTEGLYKNADTLAHGAGT